MRRLLPLERHLMDLGLNSLWYVFPKHFPFPLSSPSIPPLCSFLELCVVLPDDVDCICSRKLLLLLANWGFEIDDSNNDELFY